MRVLFTTYPEKTHFLLFAPLAWALRTAGHDVRFAVQPTFVDQVTQAGLTAVPVGSDRDLWQAIGRDRRRFGSSGLPAPYDAAERDPAELTWDHLHDGYRLQVDRWHKLSNVPMIGGLVEYARYWQPDLMIWEPVTYAGSVAAEACGAAHARLLVGTDVYGIAREQFLRLKAGRPAGDRDDPLADWLSGYARRYGFDFSEDLVTGQCTVDLLPPSLRAGATRLHRIPLRYTPYGGPAVVPRWLWAAPVRPRVALTLGLTVTERGVGYPIDVQDTLDALADLDVEVVATIAEQEQRRLRRVPDNVRLVSYVPLHALLPTCAAVVHIAGVGTLATAALTAVPQLLLPWDVDGPTMAARVAAQGAGLTVPAAAATGAVIREHLLRLLNEASFQEGADRLRDEMMTMPEPNAIVPRLESLAAERRVAA